MSATTGKGGGEMDLRQPHQYAEPQPQQSATGNPVLGESASKLEPAPFISAFEEVRKPAQPLTNSQLWGAEPAAGDGGAAETMASHYYLAGEGASGCCFIEGGVMCNQLVLTDCHRKDAPAAHQESVLPPRPRPKTCYSERDMDAYIDALNAHHVAELERVKGELARMRRTPTPAEVYPIWAEGEFTDASGLCAAIVEWNNRNAAQPK